MGLSPYIEGRIKQKMVQNEIGLVHKSLRTTGAEITHRVLSLACGGAIRGKPNLLSPFTGPSFSTKHGTLAI